MYLYLYLGTDVRMRGFSYIMWPHFFVAILGVYTLNHTYNGWNGPIRRSDADTGTVYCILFFSTPNSRDSFVFVYYS
jgi:hypothetical protein